ncbi:predicted protein [Verticillium alfalfae VaMs.102]|uniref:Predicted protein n=1 Tax=Verticillium alfalfae (strain VaMs.102 / ATCC MYA-4576 / FGSC 10136) TaxID=526221 RepID=C9SIT5_VERA1|nr:predicted protein [Verticillium alfalfae VaMs.102]EEY18858.1 predicted protein [Verticillium alfalfae VaMs.102]
MSYLTYLAILPDLGDLGCLSPEIPQSATGLADQAARDVFHHPLSPSLEDLRRQQRLIVRANRRSRVRLPTGRVSPPLHVSVCRRLENVHPASIDAALAAKRRRQDMRLRRHLTNEARPQKPIVTPQTTESVVKPTVDLATHPQEPTMHFSGQKSQNAPSVPPRNPGRTSSRFLKPRPISSVRRPILSQRQPKLRRDSATQTVLSQGGLPNSAHQAVFLGHRSSKAQGQASPVHVRSSLEVDPTLWDAVRRSLSQQSHISSLISPLEAISVSSGPLPPSRTSSQRKALDQFTQQLETFAKRRGVAGRVPVFTPTPQSATSYHTVSALLPYQAEFQSAGLAVTSIQQQERSPDRKKAPRAPLEALIFCDHRTSKLRESPNVRSEDEIGAFHLDGTSTAGSTPIPQRSLKTPRKALRQGQPENTGHTQRKHHRHDVRHVRQPDLTSQDGTAPVPNFANRPAVELPTQSNHIQNATPTKPTGLRQRHNQHSRSPPIDYSALKGLRKPPQLHGQRSTLHRPAGQAEKAATTEHRRSKAEIPTSINARASAVGRPATITEEPTLPGVTLDGISKNAKASTVSPRGRPGQSLRISARQPERKAREKLELAKKHRDMQRAHQRPSSIFSGRAPLPKEPAHPPPSPPAPTIGSTKASLVAKCAKSGMSVLEIPPMWAHEVDNASSLRTVLLDALETLQKEGDAVAASLAPVQKDASHGQGKENAVLSPADPEISLPRGKLSPQATSFEGTETKPELSAETTSASGADVLSDIRTHSAAGVSHHEATDTPAVNTGSAQPGFQGGFDDRDVLRGLRIATSAACDDDVDTWIREKTGVWIRRFLADLRAFEVLGNEPEPEPEQPEQRARRRRAELRIPKAQARRSQMAHQGLMARHYVIRERDKGGQPRRRTCDCFGAGTPVARSGYHHVRQWLRILYSHRSAERCDLPNGVADAADAREAWPLPSRALSRIPGR